MTVDATPDFWESLRHIEDRLERRLRFVAWLTSMLEKQGVTAIVVGGHALEFYTLGDYTTGDIDMVCVDLTTVREVLEKAEFQREGRHWYREDLDIVVEFPDTTLAGSRDRVERVTIGDQVVHIIGREDLLIDRLNACVHWKSEEDCRWARRLLFLYGEEMDWEYLHRRAIEEGTIETLERLWESVKAGDHDTAGGAPQA